MSVKAPARVKPTSRILPLCCVVPVNGGAIGQSPNSQPEITTDRPPP